ncbi:hypothetical protein [Spirochaeta africana]|uniref:Uncharacterized protein n=1 Tax=Spirochaeta africana (strain ATCC 700263 / DSM 8902 / Z-7692) TaxID=889378 RepID=H9UF30_SPIAZ|nr:hypothetical protein [Spirochaeta africana]AFG36123.1 hypothetical protein Spiaf_0013 [Spirochaeta africana DSM 8902]
MSLPTTDAGVRLNPALNAAEIDMYSVLLSKTRSVVDFGDPGSTLLAVRHRVKQLFSVQPNPQQLAVLRAIQQISEAEREDRVRFIQPDIGRTNARNKPVDKKRRDDWPLYYTQLWNELQGIIPDLVYINGVFPLATALEALAHIGPGTQLLLVGGLKHRRQEALQNFCDLTSSVGSLAVYRPRKNYDNELRQELLGAIRYNRRA